VAGWLRGSGLLPAALAASGDPLNVELGGQRSDCTMECLLQPPLCQRSCRLNRIGTFGGADSRKWLDTDKRTKIG